MVTDNKKETSVQNKSFEFFSEEARKRGLALIEADEYDRLTKRNEQLEEVVRNIKSI